MKKVRDEFCMKVSEQRDLVTFYDDAEVIEEFDTTVFADNDRALSEFVFSMAREYIEAEELTMIAMSDHYKFVGDRT